MSSFDPYLKWLGIRDSQRPPNHYRLLGLELFEADLDVIAAAADRQMGHLRKYQSGERGELSQKLLNEVAAAKLCLLKDETRAAYDQLLRQRSGDSTSKTPQIVVQPPTASGSQQPRWAMRRSRGTGWLIGLACGLMAGGLLAWRLVVSMNGPHTPNAEMNRTAPKVTLTEKGAPRGESDFSEEEPGLSAGKTSTLTDGAGVAPDDSSIKGRAEAIGNESDVHLDQAAPWESPVRSPPIQEIPHRHFGSRLLELIAARDTAAAERELERMEKSANSTAEQESTRRCRLVLDELVNFWTAYEQGLAELQVGQLVDYQGTPVKVQAVWPEQVTLVAANGATRQFTTNRAKVAIDLASAVVARSGASPLSIATALVAENQGPTPAALSFLQRAQPSGQRAQDLLSLYEDPPEAHASIPSDPKVVWPSTDGQSEPPLDLPDALAPIPSRELLEAADAKLAVEFRSELRETSVAARQALAHELNTKSRQPDVPPAERYALLDRSRQIALALVDVERTWQSLLELNKTFVLEPNMITATVAGLNRRIKDNGQVIELVLHGESLIDSLIDAARYETALAVVDSLLPVVRRTKVASRVEEFVSLKTEIREMKQHSATLDIERDRLRDDPHHVAANDAIGGFILSRHGNCDTAREYFARGNDPTLRRLAELDRLAAANPEAAVQAADGWWGLAESLSLHAAHRVRRHAKGLYEQVLGSLQDAERTRVQLRLEEYELLHPSLQPDWLKHIIGKIQQVKWSTGTRWKDLRFGKETVVYDSSSSGMRELPYRVDYRSKFVEIADVEGNRIYLLRMRQRAVEAVAVDSSTGEINNRGIGVSPLASRRPL